MMKQPARIGITSALFLTALTLTLSMTALAGCGGERLDFAPWTAPLPEGTEIKEYRGVPLTARSEHRIDLIEDLVIGGREDDPNYSFSRVRDLAVDGDGRIYVLDGGNARVQVFNEDGAFLQTLGEPGEEPGQLAQPSNLAVVGDRIVINDVGNSRLSVWGLDGRHQGDHTAPAPRFATTHMTGMEAGAFVTMHSSADTVPGSSLQVIAAYSVEGAELARYASLPGPQPFRIGSLVTLSAMGAMPGFAATPSGEVYVTPSRDYQVLAMDATGRARWALRVAWARQPVTDGQKELLLEGFRERVPDLDPSLAEWPDKLPALSGLAVDGEGRLYVFPYVFPYGKTTSGYPVDVYSADGSHLLSGTIEKAGWMAAHNEFIYSTKWHPETGATQVVRYVLRATALLQ
jgi:hypothetical protein